MVDIIQRENPILRGTAKEVPVKEIGSAHIQGILEDMKKAMAQQRDGVAIAAPQIGVALRIFIVSGKILASAAPEYAGDGSDLVFINPEILKLSKEKKMVEEGCLSVRWLYGKIKRATRATLRAYNEKGERIERGASGLLAQIFQHETDHLNGTLFIDNASDVWEMSAEEIAEATRK